MENASFCCPLLNTNEVQGGCNSLTGDHESEEASSQGKQAHSSGFEMWGDTNSFWSKFGFYHEKNEASKTVYFTRYKPPPLPPPPHQLQQPQPISCYSTLGDFFQLRNSAFLSNPEIEKLVEMNIQPGTSSAPAGKQSSSLSEASLELLSNNASGFKKLKGEKISNNIVTEVTDLGRWKLSTEEIMRMAGERYIQFSAQRVDDDVSATIMHRYGFASSGLSTEETQAVELAHLLLIAAENVGNRQFVRASKLLTRCQWLASKKGNPVQRLVYYFVEALGERVDRETGRRLFKPSTIMYRENENPPNNDNNSNKAVLALSSNPVFLKFYQDLPFTQVMIFAGIQSILENVGSGTKIHLIDLQIRCGVQCIVLMQALAERVSNPVQLLRVTAVGTTDEQKMVETGQRLELFAKSMNLPFSYNTVFLSDMKDLAEEHFNVESSEVVVVFSHLILRSMVSRPECLDNLMRVVRRLNPALMAVTEVEANHNSPSFFNRFVEALFFYSAYFDCLEDCTGRDNPYRNVLEGKFFGDGIRNVVAAEGAERICRNVKIGVWRAFFNRFGMVEIELSHSSLYQANLIVNRFSHARSCTLQMDGKSLIVGWKGTPFYSLSAWKFIY